MVTGKRRFAWFPMRLGLFKLNGKGLQKNDGVTWLCYVREISAYDYQKRKYQLISRTKAY